MKSRLLALTTFKEKNVKLCHHISKAMPGQRACTLLTQIFKMRNWQNSLMYVVSGKQGVKSCREMKAETVSHSLHIFIYIYIYIYIDR
jgi:hypothetical protein